LESSIRRDGLTVLIEPGWKAWHFPGGESEMTHARLRPRPDKTHEWSPQQEDHPRQPIEVQPDGTWILGRGADRWIPSANQIGDLRWVVERDLRQELGVPPKTALNKDKIEFHKRHWHCWT